MYGNLKGNHCKKTKRINSVFFIIFSARIEKVLSEKNQSLPVEAEVEFELEIGVVKYLDDLCSVDKRNNKFNIFKVIIE